MAKGQKRSSKEIRKPKQDKQQMKAEVPAGSQVKMMGAENAKPKPKK